MTAVTKPGYDGCGIPITRTGLPAMEPDAGLPPTAWGVRGVPVTRTDKTNTDFKAGSTKTVDGARAVDISKGGW